MAMKQVTIHIPNSKFRWFEHLMQELHFSYSVVMSSPVQEAPVRRTRAAAKKAKDDTLMTKEEYFAMLDKRIKSARQGHVTTLTPELQKQLFGDL